MKLKHLMQKAHSSTQPETWTSPVSNLKPEEITFNLFCSPPVHHQENKLTDQPNQFETQVSLSNLFVHQSNQ